LNCPQEVLFISGLGQTQRLAFMPARSWDVSVACEKTMGISSPLRPCLLGRGRSIGSCKSISSNLARSPECGQGARSQSFNTPPSRPYQTVELANRSVIVHNGDHLSRLAQVLHSYLVPFGERSGTLYLARGWP
jgi:hypothetical protein